VSDRGSSQAPRSGRGDEGGPSRGKRVALVLLGVVFVAINVDGIARKFRRRTHFTVASVPQLGYPRCEGAGLLAGHGGVEDAGRAEDAGRVGGVGEGEELVSSKLVALSMAVERGSWERFSLRARACHRVVSVHREGPREIVDAEVIHDEAMRPIRAWRRIGRPGPRGIVYDTRTYDFRTPFVTVTRVDAAGARTFEELRPKEKPTVVLAPGSGAMSVWIQSARLREGERVEAWVLDLRAPLERSWRSNLRREPDMTVEGLGRVRVYALDGESFFTDDRDRVVGTLAGLRELSVVGGELPMPIDGQQPAEPAR
jgi:hypothetical protein